MKRRTRKALNLSGEHAGHAIRILVTEGKIMARDVEKALTRRKALIRELRDRLAALGDEGMATIASGRRTVARKSKRRAKPRISAATRKIYQQQGRYMAAVRRLSKRDRAKVKAIREKTGVRAAIAAAKKMAK